MLALLKKTVFRTALCCSLLLSAICQIGQASPLPAIGDTPLKTQAEATFYVAGSPIAIRRLSNVISISILPVRRLSFSLTTPVRTAPGRPYAIPLVLFNNGNVATRYGLSVSSPNLAPPTVLLDTAGDGIQGNDDIIVDLSAGRHIAYAGHHALLLTGTVPADAAEGTQYDIDIAASLSSPDNTGPVGATARISLLVSAAPQMRVSLDATNKQLDLDDKTTVTARLVNSGERPLLMKETVYIDGQVHDVTLIHYTIEPGMRYVDDSVVQVVPPVMSAGIATSAIRPAMLFLDRAGIADSVPHYRTRLPAADVAGIALALFDPLMPQQEQRFAFSLRLDGDVSQAQIISHAEARDLRGAASVRSNLLIFDIAGHLAPDLALRIVQDDTAAAETATRVEIHVDNIGTAPAAGIITLRGSVPGVLRDRDISAERWHCLTTAIAPGTGGSTSFTCSSSDRIHGSSSMPPIFLTVGNPHVTGGADDDTMDGVTGGCSGMGKIAAEVSVENEPRRLLANNRAEVSLICRGGAVIRGRAWIDAANTGVHNASDEPLVGWQAELLQAGKVVHRTTTGATGRYALTGIMPGSGYSLRFLSPQGRIEAPPLAGSDDGNALPLGARRDYANGLLVYDKALEAIDYHDQNLALLPTGVIFNAVSGQPLVNARVTLSGPAGFDPLRHLVGPRSNVATVTDGDGRYNFFLTPDAPAGVYRWKAAVPGFEKADGGELLELNEKLHKTAADEVRPAYKVFDTPFAPGTAPEAVTARSSTNGQHMPAATSLASPLSHADISSDSTPRASGYFSMRRVAGAKKVVNNHLGLFPVMASDALFLEKTADRKTVEIVDFFHYRLKLGHSHAATRHGFVINDHLPRGLRYVAGSLRRVDGDVSSPLPDPAIGPAAADDGIDAAQRDAAAAASGTILRFDFSNVALLPGQPFEMTYRVAVGATAAEGARLISAANAVAGGETARASAAIRVAGGVFSNDAFVLGKVFLDCSGDIPDAPGVPGVRIYLEDGSFAETDRNGNYSLYGLKPLTHVLKMDASSLPASARAVVLDSRNAGRGDSRFLDVRNGELGRGDFALACSQAIRDEVAERRGKLERLAGADELDSALKLRFDTEPGIDQLQMAAQGDRASGLIDNRAAPAVAPAVAAIADVGAAVPGVPGAAGTVETADRAQQAVAALLKGETGLRIVNLRNGQIMPNNVSDVIVVGRSDSAFVLRVNGEIVSERQVGQRSVLESRQAAVWEYVAIALRSGANTLSLEQATAPPGAPYRIDVIVPGPPARIRLAVPPDLPADGKSVLPLEIALFDAAGIPVAAPVLLTLRSALGTWITADANPGEPGLQVLVKQGAATVFLKMPPEAGSALLSVEHGMLRETRRLQFEPVLRPMIAVGIVEGRLTLNDGKIDMAGGAGNSGFERELRTFSQASSDGRQHAAGRTALFLKGKVKGAYLLTASFDSDKDSRERLFRDIEPDKYYPVYGDDSVRGFDAQAAGKLYLRIDKGPAYLIYGDFNTADASEMRQLTQYNRAVSGVRQHFENKTAISNIFASHDSLRQQVITLRAANRRLYPHVMPDSYVPGSERVELISFDRSQPNTGQKSRLLTRHTDYTIDDLSGSFKVTEAETGFDPVNDGENYYRIVFEIDGEGEKSWLYGGDATFRIGEQLRFGATVVNDANPNQLRRLGGVFGSWRAGPQTELNAEFGWTSLGEDIAGGDGSEVPSGNGTGWRVAGKHTGERLLSEFSMIATTSAFSNLSAPIAGGRSEARLKTVYRIDDRTRFKSELLHTRDRPERESSRFGTSQDSLDDAGLGRSAGYDGLLAGVERDLGHTVKVEAGTRLVRGAIQDAGGAGQDQIPVDLLTLRGRIGAGVPYLPAASVYAEYEQDVRDREKRAFTLGADYALGGGGRLYARHELLSSLGSAYEIEENARSYRTLAGIEGDYMPGGRVFSEYRGARPFAERGPETAYGTRNTWQMTERLSLRTSLERTHAIAGDGGRQVRGGADHAQDHRGAGETRNLPVAKRGQSDSTSISTVVAYRYNARLKGSTGLDVHHGDIETSYLSTLGVGYRLGRDWTMLGKNAFYIVKGRGGERGDTGGTMRMRQRVGFAYRQNEGNRLNGLAYYEHRASRGGNQLYIDRENSHIVSMHVNFQPVRHWTLSGRYAGKYKTMYGDNGASKLSGHLLSTRVTRDIGLRWDAGIAASVFADSMGQRQQAYGIEIGHRMMDDLWISGGYNVIGFVDRDFRGMADTARGMYFRMRYKFDENSF